MATTAVITTTVKKQNDRVWQSRHLEALHVRQHFCRDVLLSNFPLSNLPNAESVSFSRLFDFGSRYAFYLTHASLKLNAFALNAPFSFALQSGGELITPVSTGLASASQQLVFTNKFSKLLPTRYLDAVLKVSSAAGTLKGILRMSFELYPIQEGSRAAPLGENYEVFST